MLTILLIGLVVVSISALWWTYAGYLIFISLLGYFRPWHPNMVGGQPLSVSVVIAARNEEDNIVGRLENLADQSYSGIVEIIVVSDGSTDRTADLARQFPNPQVVVLELPTSQGRALVHNCAVEKANGEILVFTDAETEFMPDFVEKAILWFDCSEVGAVVGRLNYRNPGKDSVAESEGLYWRLETAIRMAQSRAGLLAQGTGACFLIRKALYQKLDPREDIDFASPLDVLRAGYKVAYASDAVAEDVPFSSLSQEIRGRARQISRAWRGIASRVVPLWRANQRMVVFGLVSHKFLRWLSPLWLTLLSVSSLTLISLFAPEGPAFVLGGLAIVVVVFMAAAVAQRYSVHIPLVSTGMAFLIVNIGFAIGLVRLLRRQTPRVY